jgi:hypothetical protein
VTREKGDRRGGSQPVHDEHDVHHARAKRTDLARVQPHPAASTDREEDEAEHDADGLELPRAATVDRSRDQACDGERRRAQNDIRETVEAVESGGRHSQTIITVWYGHGSR